MPKIFLIKDRLQQQQLRLLEAQNLIQTKNSDQLNIDDNIESNTKQRVDVQEPLSLVSKKRNIQEDEIPQHLKKSSDSGEYQFMLIANLCHTKFKHTSYFSRLHISNVFLVTKFA
jgi:hypothetical protein